MAWCGGLDVFYTFMSYTHMELVIGSRLGLDPTCE